MTSKWLDKKYFKTKFKKWTLESPEPKYTPVSEVPWSKDDYFDQVDYNNPTTEQQKFIWENPPFRMYDSLEELPQYRLIKDFIKNGNEMIDKRILLIEGFATPERILQIKDAELRRRLIERYPGQLTGFLKDGGGKVIKEGAVAFKAGKREYKYASILEMDLPQGKRFYMLLINRTIEPGAMELTPDERERKGLTRDGFRKYVIGMKGTPKDYDNLYDAIGASFNLPKGQYLPDFES